MRLINFKSMRISEILSKQILKTQHWFSITIKNLYEIKLNNEIQTKKKFYLSLKSYSFLVALEITVEF